MASPLQRWLLFFLFHQLTESSASGEDSVPKMETGILGESVILSLEIPKEKQISFILWSSQRSIATIQIGKEGESSNVMITNPQYMGRMNFLSQNHYSLKINQLKMEDAGSYMAEITIANISEPIRKLFTLLIHERLTEPKITPGPRTNANGTCLINVTCSVEQARENVTYSWTLVEQGANISSKGSILSIRWRPGDHDQYTCTVRNPVSNNSHTVLARDLCAGFEHDRSYINILLGFMMPTILVIIGLIFWYIQRKKKKEANAEDQKHIAYDSNPNLRPSATEITEYATVSYPKKNIPKNSDAPNTIYDTLQNVTEVNLTHVQKAQDLQEYQTLVISSKQHNNSPEPPSERNMRKFHNQN
ncbi:SLAM family member 9-like isoform X2 [Macrotis lagotis]|uniref:SLAM family member 9-like isoform X2 n=1 Tax=Macrotis lagotis TaxID=92651 RepID=UPI003D6961D1